MKSTRRLGGICILLSLCLGIGQTGLVARCQESDDQRWSFGHAPQNMLRTPSLATSSQATDQDRYRKAVLEYRAGQLDQAASELEPLHSAASKNALGVVLEAKGEEAAALAAFQEALTLQPDLIEAAYNAARLLIRGGRPEAAISQMDAALKLRQADIAATFSLRLLRADTDAFVGDDEGAKSALSALAVERPDSAEVHFSLALTCARLGALQEAIDQLREELRLQPDNPKGLMALSKALLNHRDFSDAVTYLKQYIRLQPNDPEGYYALGYALRAAGNPNEAVEALLQAARLRPGDDTIEFHLGMALWRAGKLDAALETFRAAERLAPDEMRVHSSLARLLSVMGKKEEATEEGALTSQASERNAKMEQASMSIREGNVMLKDGDLAGAEGRFQQALVLNPKDFGAHYSLGVALADLDKPLAARDEFQQAISLDPTFAPAYNALGVSYKKDGNYAAAGNALQQAIHLNPQFAEAKNNLATLDATLGKNEEAAALFRQAAEDSPTYPEPYLNWGLLLAAQGDLKGAKMMFEKTLQIAPGLSEARKDLQIANQALGIRDDGSQ